jgi:para-nitrobenzyl esterase
MMTRFPVASTASGLVRGIDVDGIKRFLGIPYAAPTSGANRFLPPQPAVPWTGTRETYGYGSIAPQSFTGPGHPFAALIDWDLHPGRMSEDCLNLNIWTPGVADGARRPVLVYLHGGGHSQGSGNHALYTGDRLSRFGDVVVVTVNHRLGALGYVNLEDAGAPSRFAGAGNCGTLDLVSSLEWVRDNVEAFGGDPRNVTIFGQSGGGRKVSTLLSLDRARGLFHKALIQSGSSLFHPGRDAMARAARRLLAELETDWNGLLRASFESIIDAQSRMGNEAGGLVEFRPYVDGVVLSREPFSPDAPSASLDVPLVIGYCLHDLSWKYSNFDLDGQGLQEWVASLVGQEHATRVTETYREKYPHLSLFLLQSLIATDRDLFYRVITQADRKAAQGGAPVWVYRFDWRSPAFDGRFGATHGLDMSLVFHNAHQPTIGGDRREARALADTMASMLLSLARTGSPAGERLPDWPSYGPERRHTMLIDLPSQRAASDPNSRMRELWEELGWQPT